MVTLQDWFERWGFITILWFLNNYGRIHLLSLSLYWRTQNFALFLSLRYDNNPTEMIKRTFIVFCSDSTRLASNVIRHGELRFLHQWVRAMSALRSFGCLSSPHEYIVRHGDLWTFAFWNSSPLRVGGEFLLVLTALARLSLVIASWEWVIFDAHSLSSPSTCLCSPLRAHLLFFSLYLVSSVQFLHKWVN